MSERTLKVAGKVRRLIRHLHPQTKAKVRAALNDILAEPKSGKPLQREYTDTAAFELDRIESFIAPTHRVQKSWHSGRGRQSMKKWRAILSGQKGTTNV